MDAMKPEEIGMRYDQIVDVYQQNRSSTYGLEYIQIFLDMFPIHQRGSHASTILDIGCGTGIPLTNHLALCGAKVIGLDISAEMIRKARINVPDALFVVGDILSANLNQKFDGILAWDSLFHIPLEKQEEVIRKVIGLLNKNGLLLFTTGGTHGDLYSKMFGTEFYYSSLSEAEYIEILVVENCEVIINEVDDPSSRGHRVICCRKK